MRELAIMREIDSLEEELLDMMNHKSLGGDSCDIRLILKRPSTVPLSEYHSQLMEYITLCSQQVPPHYLQTDSRTTLDHNNTDDIIITIVTK